ncbi:Coiled-coil domain-containing protein r3hcc1l, partial [Borealophlyctis nickersoniae]
QKKGTEAGNDTGRRGDEKNGGEVDRLAEGMGRMKVDGKERNGADGVGAENGVDEGSGKKAQRRKIGKKKSKTLANGSEKEASAVGDETTTAVEPSTSVDGSEPTLAVAPSTSESSQPEEGELEDWERSDEDVSIPLPQPKPSPAAKPTTTTRRTITRQDVDHLDGPSQPTTALEVYDFPAAFKTHELQLIFEEYEDVRGGYRIKWLDDTRALVVFQHPSTAKMAYISAVDHPFVKVRPYAGRVILDSRPGSPTERPVTTDMVARRLIAGALGVRSKRKTEEEAAVDKAKLQDIKDKRQAVKEQKLKREQEVEAAWEG